MLHPRDMQKVSITGPKSQLGKTARELHSLGLLDIDDYDGQYDEFQVGEPEDIAEKISDLLVRIRSLRDQLPDKVDYDRTAEIDSLSELRQRLSDIRDEVETLTEDIEDLEERKTDAEKQLNSLKALKKLDIDPEDIQDIDAVDYFLGTVETTDFTEDLPDGRYELHQDGNTVLLIADTSLDTGELLGREGFDPLPLEFLYDIDTGLDKAIRDKKEQLESIQTDIEQDREGLETLARKHGHYLEANEQELARELTQVEAPLRFATSDSAFIAEGWVPEDAYPHLEERLNDAAAERIHVQKEEPEDDESPPVEHHNPGIIKPFEPLTDLVAVPKYSEVDPSFLLLLTFPLFFGFMIGDAGYGLTSFIVFYLGMRMYPSAKKIFKALMYASVATFLFGLAFGDAFGYIIFGSDSALTALTGIQLFSQIPVLFHRSHHLGQVFTIAALIGVVHINLGYLLGGYTEYINHGLKAALLEKGSWVMIEIGALLWYLYGSSIGAPVVLAAIIMLWKGEGIEGIVEIPSLLSNILSYLRIFGVAVAAISLAGVVNSLADPLLTMGTWYGLVGGTLVLMLGHIFNTFIKIMEGFLQGIRLHYVEMFSKFFEGGGRRYQPFGGEQ